MYSKTPTRLAPDIRKGPNNSEKRGQSRKGRRLTEVEARRRHLPYPNPFKSLSDRNRRTTSDIPLSGVKVTITIPPVAFVRVSPSI